MEEPQFATYSHRYTLDMTKGTVYPHKGEGRFNLGQILSVRWLPEDDDEAHHFLWQEVVGHLQPIEVCLIGGNIVYVTSKDSQDAVVKRTGLYLFL
jgi:hypothetical protein